MPRTVSLNLPAALDAVLVEKATGNDTPETLASRIVEEWCAPFAKAKEAQLLELMRPVGAEIAAAAGGDPVKIAAALEVGKTAALAAIA